MQDAEKGSTGLFMQNGADILGIKSKGATLLVPRWCWPTRRVGPHFAGSGWPRQNTRTHAGSKSRPLHATNLLLVHVLVEARVEVLPPVEEHRVADELEPGGELEGGILEHLLQAVGRDPLRGSHLVLTGGEINVGLDEEDVVD